MAAGRPELIFVRGPQQGQRSTPLANAAIVGRDPNCDVQVTEKTVSRQQIRLDLTADGWMATNLSSNPIRINGKRYKAGRQVLLDTGDVLALGRETEILFVAADDDPERALAAHRMAQPQAEPDPAEAPDQTGEPVAEAEPADQPPTEAVPAAAAPATAPISVADELARAKKAKKRKYLIGFAVYAAGMIVLIAVLASIKSGGDGGGPRRPQRKLTDRQIAEAISASLDVPSYPTEAEHALQKAREHHAGELDTPGDLYRAVKYFKLYLAYRGSPQFEQTRDQRAFRNAQRKLTEQVQGLYRDAWAHENARQWPKALALYEELLRMLPVKEEPYPEENNVIFRNVLEHVGTVRTHMKRKRR